MEQEFLEDIVVRVERTGIPYAITGSIASNFWGIPRTTHDVDVVVVLSAHDVERMVSAFADRYYVSEAGVRDAVRQRSMFNVIDLSKGLKADFWITTEEPFDQSLLSRRQRLQILPGREAYIGSPEDVLLHKLVWNGITPSERQLADAAGIAAVQAGKLDLAYLRSWAAQQSTAQVLEEVLQGKYLKRT